MSEEKKYTPAEAAKMILNGVHKYLKKNEEVLSKSKNSAHEIDMGSEPNDDNAECPESLKSENSKSSESPEMEDQPLQESEDKEEKESKDKDTEEEKKEYEFKKSEDGMFEVEYKRLVKFLPLGGTQSSGTNPSSSILQGKPAAPAEGSSIASQIGFDKDEKLNPSFDREKKDIEWTNPQTKEINRTKPGKTPSKRSDQAKFIAEAKERRKKMREQGLLKDEDQNKAKKTKGISFDESKKDCDCDKKDSECMNKCMEKKSQMEKCGEMSSSKKLKKFMNKKMK